MELKLWPYPSSIIIKHVCVVGKGLSHHWIRSEDAQKNVCSMLQKVDFCTVLMYAKLMLMAKSTLVTLSIHG